MVHILRLIPIRFAGERQSHNGFRVSGPKVFDETLENPLKHQVADNQMVMGFAQFTRHF